MEGKMPTPKAGESEKEYIARCVPTVMKEGTAKDPKQAAAICYSMWREHKEGKALEDVMKAVESRGEYVRVRVKEPGAFQEGSFRTIVISKSDGIHAVIGRPKGKTTTEVQAYLFEKERWTEERAKKWVAAHKEGKAFPIKTLREEDGGVIVGGPLLLWGSAGQKDLQGEYFTPETELWLDTYKSAPALFHHGLDDTVGLAVMGHRVKTEVRDSGVWVEDWLNTSNQYWAFVEPLLAAEKLFYSPGSAPHLVKRAQDGRLLSFPIVEDTLTPIPAQHRLLPVEQVKAAYKAAGIDLPQLLELEAGPQRPGEGDGGPSRLTVERAKAKAEATLFDIRLLEEA
jgi:hypothetical protein